MIGSEKNKLAAVILNFLVKKLKFQDFTTTDEKECVKKLKMFYHRKSKQSIQDLRKKSEKTC